MNYETKCNICGSTEFQSLNLSNTAKILCAKCGSLGRHRAVHYVLNTKNLLAKQDKISRCLHLAPERCLSKDLSSIYRSGYIPADPLPNFYRHTQCLKIHLLDDLQIFPNEYFDLILHNHVLEHIPGSYKTAINDFYRLLSPAGIMIFTVPAQKIVAGLIRSLEGGEHLVSDEDRLHVHGQHDHYKTFGLDLIEYLFQIFSVCQIFFYQLDSLTKKLLRDHNIGEHELVFYCQK